MKKKLNLTYREILKRASLSFNKNTDVIAFGDHKYLLDSLIEEDFLKDFNMYDNFDALIKTCYEDLKKHYECELEDIPFKVVNDNLKKLKKITSNFNDFNDNLKDLTSDFKDKVILIIANNFYDSVLNHNFVLYSAEKDDTGKVAYIHKHWLINEGIGFLSDWKWTEAVISRNTLKLLGVVRP